MASLEDIKKLFEASDKNTNTGFAEIKKDMKTFKEDITKLIKDTNEKVDQLEKKLKEKDEEIATLKRDFNVKERKNNLILFNVQETDNSLEELQGIILSLFRKFSDNFSESDFSDVFRIGKKDGRCRPIVVSFVSQIKLRTVLANKHRLKNENVSVAQDFPKEVMEERRRLQPMITFLNKSGKRASLRIDEVVVDGKKLNKKETEAEMSIFREATKRPRSPTDEITEENERMPKLHNPSLSQRVDDVPITTPTRSQPSTPSRLFPVFSLQQIEANTLSPIAGGSKNAKAFEFRSDK